MALSQLTKISEPTFTFSVPSLLNFSSFIKDDKIKVDKQWVQPFYAISA